jgi:aspartate 1-decarboxylase
MLRDMLKSKIHRASVTDANLDYIGSITIDEELMEKADIRENEKVFIVNINTGARFETYAIKGKRNSGEICLNGAAARLVQVKDKVIIMSFGVYSDEDLKNYMPLVVHVNEDNKSV